MDMFAVLIYWNIWRPSLEPNTIKFYVKPNLDQIPF